MSEWQKFLLRFFWLCWCAFIGEVVVVVIHPEAWPILGQGFVWLGGAIFMAYKFWKEIGKRATRT